MKGRSGERGTRKAARRLASVSGALAVVSISGILLFGGCAGAPWPSNGKLPEGVVGRLTECGKKGPVPFESVSYDLTFTVHATEDEAQVRVDEVMLTGSTLLQRRPYQTEVRAHHLQRDQTQYSAKAAMPRRPKAGSG